MSKEEQIKKALNVVLQKILDMERFFKLETQKLEERIKKLEQKHG